MKGKTGFIQGDTLTPILFLDILVYVLHSSFERLHEKRTAFSHRQCSQYPPQYLSDLDFADDVALIP